MRKQGAWFIESKSDPRWNDNGEAVVGGFAMPKEAKAAIEKKKKELGEAPKDLEWSYHKY